MASEEEFTKTDSSTKDSLGTAGSMGTEELYGPGATTTKVNGRKAGDMARANDTTSVGTHGRMASGNVVFLDKNE